MFDAYLELPAWLRTTVACVTLGVGLLLVYYGYWGDPHETVVDPVRRQVVVEQGHSGAFRGGIAVSGIGLALLATCGKSRSEKSGYNF
jgi:hypothetical protein